MSEMIEPAITIHEARCLMEVLDKDIPDYDKSRIALLLLILAANPSLAKEGKEIVTSKFSRSSKYHGTKYDDDYYSEYY